MYINVGFALSFLIYKGNARASNRGSDNVESTIFFVPVRIIKKTLIAV